MVVEVGRRPGCPFRKVWAKVLAEPPRKVRRPLEAPRPVPQTDTGGWVEKTKVRERNHVKELGKMAP